MTLQFTPSAFALPFTMATSAEAAQIVTVALHGPWVFKHQHPASDRHEEARQAQEQALVDMYGLLNTGDLTAYVEDPRTRRFLRVPTEYYVEDAWAFGRCFSLSKLLTAGIPFHLEEQPLLFLRSELDAWVAAKARQSTVKRGPKPKYDAEGFISAAVAILEHQGGFVIGEFERPAWRRQMLQWCADTWDSEPGESWLNDHLAQAQKRYEGEGTDH